MKKSDREIMEILEAFDATGCAHSAAPLAGVDPKTVRRVRRRAGAGQPVDGPVRRPKLIDPFLAKIEELVETSEGAVRADVVHERLVAMGFTGDERTTRRAVAEAKDCVAGRASASVSAVDHRAGAVAAVRLGCGPIVFGPDGRPRPTLLFCAWLAWSRFRVVLPTWDRKLGTLLTCLDATLRRVGGAPTYALTDNEKTVTVEHVAGVPVRHPMIVAAGRHYGLTVHTCVPFDPESKGGSEATVRIAKADLVPTKANLLTGYNSFAELAEACEAFCDKVNGRVHRETSRIPAEALLVEQGAAASDPGRAVHRRARGDPQRQHRPDHPVRVGALLHPTRPGRRGGLGPRRRRRAGHHRRTSRPGLIEVARHRLSTPGNPRIDLSHYPDHPQQPDGSPKPPQPKGRSTEEKAFLALGPGAHSWLVEAAAVGAQRVRSKMTAALELAALVGTEPVDAALGVAAAAGRFAEGDLLAIVPAPRQRRLHRRAGGRRRGPLRPARHQRLGQPSAPAPTSTGEEHR